MTTPKQNKITTKIMEKELYKALQKLGTYICFEVAMPREYRGTGAKERVDCLSYDTKGDWRFYELKLTKSDFNSKCKHTFLGHLNYYVMPYDLWLNLKNQIPKEIGVYTISEYESGKFYCTCQKKAKRQELRVNEEHLKFNFMQALYREYQKYLTVRK